MNEMLKLSTQRLRLFVLCLRDLQMKEISSQAINKVKSSQRSESCYRRLCRKTKDHVPSRCRGLAAGNDWHLLASGAVTIEIYANYEIACELGTRILCQNLMDSCWSEARRYCTKLTVLQLIKPPGELPICCDPYVAYSVSLLLTFVWLSKFFAAEGDASCRHSAF